MWYLFPLIMHVSIQIQRSKWGDFWAPDRGESTDRLLSPA